MHHNGATASISLAVGRHSGAMFASPAPEPVRPPVHIERQAVATVRVLTSASASAKDWESTPEAQRREILIRETDGRITRLRLIEHE